MSDERSCNKNCRVPALKMHSHNASSSTAETSDGIQTTTLGRTVPNFRTIKRRDCSSSTTELQSLMIPDRKTGRPLTIDGTTNRFLVPDGMRVITVPRSIAISGFRNELRRCFPFIDTSNLTIDGNHQFFQADKEHRQLSHPNKQLILCVKPVFNFIL